MQFGNQGAQQALRQAEQIIQQLVNQTNQATQNYQQLLQQEQQNVQRLEELAQREQRAAQTIQTALQGHGAVVQQLQHVIQLCHQVEQSVQNQSFNSSIQQSPYANAQTQFNPAFSQQNGSFSSGNQGIQGFGNTNFRSQ